MEYTCKKVVIKHGTVLRWTSIARKDFSQFQTQIRVIFFKLNTGFATSCFWENPLSEIFMHSNFILVFHRYQHKVKSARSPLAQTPNIKYHRNPAGCLGQGCTIFRKIYEPPQNSKRQKVDLKQWTQKHSGASVQNWDARATWRPRFMRPFFRTRNTWVYEWQTYSFSVIHESSADSSV
jgi:hypothetical protein